MTLCRQRGDRDGEAWTLDSLGILQTHLDQPEQAAEYHQPALAIFRRTGGRDGETYALPLFPRPRLPCLSGGTRLVWTTRRSIDFEGN